MKRIVLVGVGLAAALATPAAAASVFDGTWVADMSSAKLPAKPDVFELRDGSYSCRTCVPAYTIKADGAFHKVAGNPYYDERSVKVVDARTIEERGRKSGKLVLTQTARVAADGKSATFEYVDSSATDAAPVKGKGTATRVAAGPPGSHAISGAWRAERVDDVSANGITVTYRLDGDRLAMSTPTGQSYLARLDGTEAPYKGDPGTTSVTVVKTGPRTLVETDKRDGKVIGVVHTIIGADGATAQIAYDDRLHGTTMSFKATKR